MCPMMWRQTFRKQSFIYLWFDVIYIYNIKYHERDLNSLLVFFSILVVTPSDKFYIYSSTTLEISEGWKGQILYGLETSFLITVCCFQRCKQLSSYKSAWNNMKCLTTIVLHQYYIFSSESSCLKLELIGCERCSWFDKLQKNKSARKEVCFRGENTNILF